MHPDDVTLAAYLDGLLDAPAQARVRAHSLGCSRCSARLAQLRADALTIPRALQAVAAPDLRGRLHGRVRRPGLAGRLAGGLVLAGAVVLLLGFLLLLDPNRGSSALRAPALLVVADSRNNRLLLLAAEDGASVGQIDLAGRPGKLRYDPATGRLYVLLPDGLAVVDMRQRAVVARWAAPEPLPNDGGLALGHGRVYLALPGAVQVLDATTLAPVRSYAGFQPGSLLLAPGGQQLYTLDRRQGLVWVIDLASGVAKSLLIDRSDVGQFGWLALAPDARQLYVLRAGSPPQLAMVDLAAWQVLARVALAATPRPQDLLVLPGGQLALARGDGTRGGVELLDGGTLQSLATLDRDTDQHSLLLGPGNDLIALNWLHGKLTRYRLAAGQEGVVWQTRVPEAEPREGVLIAGGWRWP